MNILFIRTNAVNPDPRVEKEVNSLISNKNNSVTILAWDRDSNSDSKSVLKLRNGDAEIIRFGIRSEWGGGMKKNLIPLLRFSFRVKKWLKKYIDKFDCLHCCDLPTALMCGRFLKRKKFVYDLFDYFPDTAHAPRIVLNYARRKEKEVIEMADCTIICSEQRIEQIGDAKPKKLVVIHNSPDDSFLKCSSERILKDESDPNKIKLVYVGNLISERFVEQIVEAVSKHSDLELHIGGIGPLADYVKKASQNQSNIFYYGKLEYKDVISLENDCDVLIALYNPAIANNRYAAPNKYYESLLVGKPIIMLKKTGMDSFVDKWSHGVVISDVSSESLYSASFKAKELSNNTLLFKEKTRKIYDSYFSWTIMEKRLLSIYEFIENQLHTI